MQMQYIKDMKEKNFNEKKHESLDKVGNKKVKQYSKLLKNRRNVSRNYSVNS